MMTDIHNCSTNSWEGKDMLDDDLEANYLRHNHNRKGCNINIFCKEGCKINIKCGCDGKCCLDSECD